MFMQAFAIRAGGDPAAGETELDGCVQSASTAISKLLAQSSENDVPQIVVTEKSIALGRLASLPSRLAA